MSDGLRLAPRGPVRRSGPLDATVEVDVRAVRPSLVQRVSAAVGRFWREPVRCLDVKTTRSGLVPGPARR